MQSMIEDMKSPASMQDVSMCDVKHYFMQRGGKNATTCTVQKTHKCSVIVLLYDRVWYTVGKLEMLICKHDREQDKCLIAQDSRKHVCIGWCLLGGKKDLVLPEDTHSIAKFERKA